MDEGERQRLKAFYKELYFEISEILFRHDPIGINFEDNTDEYEPEVSTILPRLASANSINEVRLIIYEEFVKWFDKDLAGPEEIYSDIAEEVWKAWQKWSK
ncbi:MAG: hypothetical protein ACYCV0_08095 [Desulfitobacteriaceae bacterium]